MYVYTAKVNTPLCNVRFAQTTHNGNQYRRNYYSNDDDDDDDDDDGAYTFCDTYLNALLCMYRYTIRIMSDDIVEIKRCNSEILNSLFSWFILYEVFRVQEGFLS